MQLTLHSECVIMMQSHSAKDHFSILTRRRDTRCTVYTATPLTEYCQPYFSAKATASSLLVNSTAASATDEYGSPVDVQPMRGFSHLEVDQGGRVHTPSSTSRIRAPNLQHNEDSAPTCASVQRDDKDPRLEIVRARIHHRRDLKMIRMHVSLTFPWSRTLSSIDQGCRDLTASHIWLGCR